MKKLIFFVVACALVVDATRGATVVGNTIDAAGNPTVDVVRFVPPHTYIAYGTNTVVCWPVRAVVDTNNNFSTFLVGGFYDVYFGGDDTLPPLRVLVPLNDTNVYNLNQVAQLAVNASMFGLGNVTITNFLPNGAITNNQSGVTLSGTFGGSGSSLGGMSPVNWGANVSGSYPYPGVAPFDNVYSYGLGSMVFGMGLVALDDAGEFPTFLCYGSIVQSQFATLWVTWDNLPMDFVDSAGGMFIGGRDFPKWTNTVPEGCLVVSSNLTAGSAVVSPSVIASGSGFVGSAAGETNFLSLTVTNSANLWLANGGTMTCPGVGMVSVSVLVTNTQIVWLTNLTSHICVQMGNTAGAWTNWDNAQLWVNKNDVVSATNVSGAGGSFVGNSSFQMLR